jgi:hypothetical protein
LETFPHAIALPLHDRTTGGGALVFDLLGRAPPIPDETEPARRQGVERLLVLLGFRILARLSGWRFSHRKSHYPLGWGAIRLCGFPEIHTRSRYFKALVLIEDPLNILGTGHVHDPEAERMAALIPQNLCMHHSSKRDEGLTKRVIGAKVGQPADMDLGTHVTLLEKKKIFKYNWHYA